MRASLDQRVVRLGYIFLIIIAAIAFCWLSLAVTDALVAKGVPGRGLGWRTDAVGRAKLAAAISLDMSNTNLAAARAQAEAAMRREPINVVAARSLAIIWARQGNRARADRLFRYAESVSRRDLATQLMLIESSVRRNDIPGALKHYDRAIRTSPSADTMLLSMLVNAATETLIRRELAALLASRPPWWPSFAYRLTSSGKSATAIFELIGRLRLNPAIEGERKVLASALDRLVDMRAFDLAFRLYAGTGQVDTSESLIRNGGFESEILLPPFDWTLTNEADLWAIRQPHRGAPGQYALYLNSNNGEAGVVAHQLLLLPRGHYNLSAVVGDVPADSATRPRLIVNCLDSPNQLVELDFPRDEQPGTKIQAEFEVRSDCSLQRIMMAVRPQQDQRVESWIDSIALQRH